MYIYNVVNLTICPVARFARAPLGIRSAPRSGRKRIAVVARATTTWLTAISSAAATSTTTTTLTLVLQWLLLRV
jgi:hypothetical protein